MKTIETDILIVGNGLAGSTFAAAILHHPFFAERNFAGIHLLDMNTPTASFHQSLEDMPYDIRISSVNRGSENIIKQVGAWPHLNEARVFPYRYVEVSDTDSSDNSALRFDAVDNELSHMGNMIENQHLVHALHQTIAQQTAQCQMHFEHKIESIEYDDRRKKWHVSTNKGNFIAQLLVGADGRNSVVRDAGKIGVSKGFYQQKCIVGNIAVDGTLNSTAWQRFLATGPIGILPMSNEGDSPARFSLAWSHDTPEVDDIMLAYQQDPQQFIDKLQPLLPSHFGAIVDVNNIASYPLWHQQANSYHVPGLVLIGDAAHGIHPLAGLGANLGIRDAAVLAEQLFAVDLLDNDVQLNFACQQYQKHCKDYNSLALHTMGLFKSVFSAKDSAASSVLSGMVSGAISLVNKTDIIKSKLLQSATGLDRNAPNLAAFINDNADQHSANKSIDD